MSDTRPRVVAPPIRVDRVQLEQALEPVVDALRGMTAEFAKAAAALTVMGEQMSGMVKLAQDARQARLRTPSRQR